MRVERDEQNVEVPQQSAAPTPPRIAATRAFSPLSGLRSQQHPSWGRSGCSQKPHVLLVSRSHRPVTVHGDTSDKGETRCPRRATGKLRVTRRRVGGLVGALALLAVGLTAVATSGAATGPINTTAPSVTGAAQQGQTLTTSNGVWATTPTGYIYSWQRCNPDATGCADIGGATRATYTLGAADVGSVDPLGRRRDATARATARSPHSATTATVTAAASLAPANTTPASITGTPTNGQTLSAVDGQWTGATPITFTYVWQLCDATGAACLPITGATAKTYVLTSAAVGKTLRVVR